MNLPVIAIVGRPNVGKSALFNRLVGLRIAITTNIPGTTRDRMYHETLIGKTRVILADTGGMEFDEKHSIEADVQRQARLAALEADMIFFVTDASLPLTASDRDASQFLRKARKPVLLIGQKADRKQSELGMTELFELGFGEPLLVSALHNIGIQEMESAAEKAVKKIMKEKGWKTSGEHKGKELALAIVGRPNVGKSSLINALLQEERLIVSEKPGTTMDAIDTSVTWEKKPYTLIDTAGIRRRGKVQESIERLGVLRALRAISRSDIACLMLDGSEPVSNQDLHVAEYVLEAGKGLILLINKTDLMDDPGEDKKIFLNRLSRRMAFAPWAPVSFISALSKKNIFDIFSMAQHIHEERGKRVPSQEFNLFAKTTAMAHPLVRNGKHVIIRKGAQTGFHPPEFTFETETPDLVHFSYRRYLENEIRRKYGFYGTPLSLLFTQRLRNL